MRNFRENTLLLALLAALLLSGCPKKDDVIVKTGEGKELGEVAIDHDPLALLPASAIAVFALDAKQLFLSEFGTKLLALSKRRLPLPPSAGFEPGRDLDKVYVGTYSMSGVDVAGVALGRFDKAKIEAAADGTQKTPLGQPVTKSKYAGRTLYTSGNAGFTILTSKTALFGNETGIRRALDRIKEGRAKRQLPAAMEKLLSTQTAPLVVGADFASHPLPDAVRRELPFMNGAKTLGLVGNFQPPGLNVAGTIGYGETVEAQKGAEGLLGAQVMLERFAPVLQLLGIPQPVTKLQAQAKEKAVEFAIELDGKAIAVLLDRADEFLGVPAQPSSVPATTTKSVAQ